MREPSARKRQRLLEEAFDQGIRHFDVARMYGLGAAEAELGNFARGRRESIVIATKFGIEAASAPGRLAHLQGPARRLLARYPAIRGYVKRRTDAFHRPHSYDADTARTSLHTSLRELKTDYVDLLLIHDPAPADRIDLSEIRGFLEGAREAGLVRAWGIAGERDPCIQIRRLLSQSAVLQVREDILSRTSQHECKLGPRIAFGILGETLKRILTSLNTSPERCRRWSDAVGLDCSSPEVLASLLLREALQANPEGVVLFNTTRPERLRGLDDLLAHSEDAPDLAALKRQVNRDLAPAS